MRFDDPLAVMRELVPWMEVSRRDKDAIRLLPLVKAAIENADSGLRDTFAASALNGLVTGNTMLGRPILDDHSRLFLAEQSYLRRRIIVHGQSPLQVGCESRRG